MDTIDPGAVDSSRNGSVADGRPHRRTSQDPALHYQLLDELPAAIYTTDAAGRITYYNEAAVDLAGRRPELGKDEWCVSWRLYWPNGTPMPHDQCPMAVTLRENRPIRGTEAILERPDGTRVWFIPYPAPLRDESGVLVGAVNMLVDITDRHAAENARAYLAAIINNTEDAIVSKSLDGIVTSWNRAAEAIFGYRADEVIGRSITLIVPQDRLAEENMILDRLRRGEGLAHFETVRRRKDGHEIDVSVTISPIRDSAGRLIGASKIAHDISEKKRIEQMLRNVNGDLERRVAERTHELAEAIERLRAEAVERERAEAALRQAQKMEAIGQVASGIAHDFNNLLTSILGNLELVEMRITDERLRKLVQAAARSARRGAALNNQMLAFSRKQHLAPKTVDLNALISGMTDMLGRTLGGTIEVKTALDRSLWPALVDPTQFELVILNLAINARDAMAIGGRLVIETRNVPASALTASIGLVAGDYVLISVSDNGIGMTEEVLERACEPFYTTKETGKGSGLGLSQVYGLAQQSRGGIRMRSAVGEGTTVEVYLPRSRAKQKAAKARDNDAPEAAAGIGATVLVVDDQEDVREVAVSQLEVLGYNVVQAATGRTALDLLGRVDGIDLLIADYAMPGMSGAELMRAVRARCPALPIVIVTGYVETGGVGGQIGDAILLKKPYRISELGASVELALRRKRDRGRGKTCQRHVDR